MASRVYHPDHHKAPTRNPPRKVGASKAPSQSNAPPESFQSIVDSVEIFASSGKNPLLRAATKGSVHRVYERNVKGYAYTLEGSGGASKMQLPRDAAKGLGLVQRYLVLQLEIPPEPAALAFEVALTDAKRVRRRLLFSTAFQNLTISSLHAQIPLSSFIGPLRSEWANFTVDLISFASFCFGNQRSSSNQNMVCDYSCFKKLESVTMGPVCKVRKIFTMKSPPIQNVTYDDMEESVFDNVESVDIPLNHSFPDSMEPVPNTIIFTASEFMQKSTPRSHPSNGMVSGGIGVKGISSRKGNDLTSIAAKLNSRGPAQNKSVVSNTGRTMSRKTDISNNHQRPSIPTTAEKDYIHPDHHGAVSAPSSSSSSSRNESSRGGTRAHVAFGSRWSHEPSPKPSQSQQPQPQQRIAGVKSDRPPSALRPNSARANTEIHGQSNEEEVLNDGEEEFDFRQGSYHHKANEYSQQNHSHYPATTSNDHPPPPPSTSMTSSLYQVDDTDDITARYIASLTGGRVGTAGVGRGGSDHNQRVDMYASNTLPPPPLNVTTSSQSTSAGKKATLYSPYPPPSSRNPSQNADPYDELGSMPSTASPHQSFGSRTGLANDGVGTYNDVGFDPDQYGYDSAAQRDLIGMKSLKMNDDDDDRVDIDEDDYLLGQTPLGESLKFRHNETSYGSKERKQQDGLHSKPPLSHKTHQNGLTASSRSTFTQKVENDKNERSLMLEVSSTNNPWDDNTTGSPMFSANNINFKSPKFNMNSNNDKRFVSSSTGEKSVHENYDTLAVNNGRHFENSPDENTPSRYDEHNQGVLVSSRRSDSKEDATRRPAVNNGKYAEEWAPEHSRMSSDSFPSSNRSVGVRRSADSNHSHPLARSIDSDSSHHSQERSLSLQPPPLIPSILQRMPSDGSNTSLNGRGPSSKERRSLKVIQGNLDPYSSDAYDPNSHDVDAYLASPKDFERPPSPIRTSQEFKPSTDSVSMLRRSNDSAHSGAVRKSQDLRSSTSSIHSAKYFEEKYDEEQVEQNRVDEGVGRLGVVNKVSRVEPQCLADSRSFEDKADFDQFYESNKHRVPTSWEVAGETIEAAGSFSRDSALVNEQLSPTFDGSLEQFPNDGKVNIASPTRRSTTNDVALISTSSYQKNATMDSPPDSKHSQRLGENSSEDANLNSRLGRSREHDFTGLPSQSIGRVGISYSSNQSLDYGDLGESGGSDILAELERRERELLEMEAAFNEEEVNEESEQEDDDTCLMGTQTDLKDIKPVLDEEEELLFRDAFGVSARPTSGGERRGDGRGSGGGGGGRQSENANPKAASSSSSHHTRQSHEKRDDVHPHEGMAPSHHLHRENRKRDDMNSGGMGDSFTTNNSYLASPSDLEDTITTEDPLGQTYNKHAMQSSTNLESSVLLNSKGNAAFDSSNQKQNQEDTMGENSVTGDESLELMFNPILNCYYDPKSGKFYQLKDE